MEQEQQKRLLSKNLSQIQARLNELGRSNVQIIAVTKTRSARAIYELQKLGVRDIGENRFGEARDKLTELAKIHTQSTSKEANAVYHHIGPLQSGNARQIPRIFSWVHGVSDMDSLKTLAQVALRQQNKGEAQVDKHPSNHYKITWPIKYLIQLRLTQEATKVGGMLPDEFCNLTNLPQNDALHFSGLMTMGPFNQGASACRETFHRLRSLRDEYAPDGLLSMGMSNDWEIAVSEGADMIRIGSVLFRE